MAILLPKLYSPSLSFSGVQSHLAGKGQSHIFYECDDEDIFKDFIINLLKGKSALVKFAKCDLIVKWKLFN